MAGLCKVTIIGHLGRDPEVRYTPDGLAVTKFSVAATERFKGEERTQWFRVTAFGKLGEICGEYLSKGRQVFVEGRLETSEWDDRDGNKRFSLEVIANQMLMLGSKGDTYDPSMNAAPRQQAPPRQQPPPSQAPQAAPRPAPVENQTPDMPGPPAGGPPDDDDIPF